MCGHKFNQNLKDRATSSCVAINYSCTALACFLISGSVHVLHVFVYTAFITDIPDLSTALCVYFSTFKIDVSCPAQSSRDVFLDIVQ